MLLVLLCISLFGCKKESPNPENCPDSPISKLSVRSQGDTSLHFESGMYVLNEGTFTFGNASITYYDPETRQLVQDAFSTANGRGIGDVLQSAQKDEDRMWCVVNNSQKIELVDIHSLQSVSIFAGFGAPRYATIYNGYLVVTELFGAGVWQMDTSVGCIEKHFETGGWTEFLVRDANGDLYTSLRPALNDDVTQPAILKLDESGITSFALPSIPLGFIEASDYFVLLDEQDGNGQYRIAAINLMTGNLDVLVEIDSLPAPPIAFTSGWGGEAYFLSGGLWRFDGMSATRVVTKTGTWYGMAVDQSRKELYLFDAGDYVSRGMAYRLNSNYQVIDSFETGVIPNSAIFF